MRGMKRILLHPRIRPLLLLLLCLGSSSGAFAVIVDGLYDQEIVVQGQGDAERLRAYREGLSAAILKITGEQRWLRNSAVERAIRDAQSYVQEVSYRTSAVGLEQRTYISVRFDRALVENMLNSAGIPVWDQNRPTVMLWLSVQGPDGRRELLGADSEHPLLEIVREYSRIHGVPLLFPLMDLEDRRNLPIDVAWSLDAEAIRTASQRYEADAILSGRILESTGGDLVGLWQFLFRDKVESFDSFEQDYQRYGEAALERITPELASHYGLLRLNNPLQIRLQVANVDSARDYKDLLQYIQSLAVVENVSAALLNGDSIELDLSLTGNVFLFTEFIALGREMAAVPSTPELVIDESAPQVLQYRWLR